MINLSYKPFIQGEKVLLRPFQAETDFPSIKACLQDPVVLKYTGSSEEFDSEKVEKWYETRNNQTDRLDLAIIRKETDQLIGEVVLNSYDVATHSMNFRTLIGPNGRDQGFGTEATNLIIDYAFENTELDALTLSVFAFNPRARHVYESLGFILTSIDENDLEYQGEWIDSLNMQLTRKRWQQLKSK